MNVRRRKSTAPDYSHGIVGVGGEFHSVGGTVKYLTTRAKLKPTGTDMASKLMPLLRPVREMLPTDKMNFNQLLQRDLDDHRVATTLIPYLLSSRPASPAFFPPLVAALLPFQGPSELASEFPAAEQVNGLEGKGFTWNGTRFGDAYQITYLPEEDGPQPDEMSVYRLQWNPEKAGLVVIDGQHRAMALLAIYRTIASKWGDSGSEYKHFYEGEIERQLEGKNREEITDIISGIEIPVTIVWFPDQQEVKDGHLRAARNLFVDINKNARKPSDSRIILLSEHDLLSIFTQAVLEEIRRENRLPIYCVEYDHPGGDQASYSKWSVVTNIIIIREMVSRCIFGPRKYITDVSQKVGGRESERDRDAQMQSSLRISDWFMEEEEGVKRADIGNEKFPTNKVSDFKSACLRTWGKVAIKLLAEVLPYKTHCETMEQLRSGWSSTDTQDRLASKAIFDGVGMYWTIKDSFDHWKDRNTNLRLAQREERPATDIVNTWHVLQSKKQEFEKLRAFNYVGGKDSEMVLEVNNAFSTFNTSACQVGLVMCARTLALELERDSESLDALESRLGGFVGAFVQTVNASLELGSGKGRRLIFSTRGGGALNQLKKLDTHMWVYFRYFWLEIVQAEFYDHGLDRFVNKESLDKLIYQGRWLYLDYLAREKAKAVKVQEPDISDALAKEKGADIAKSELKKALSKWFKVKSHDFETWFNGGAPASVEAVESPAIEDDEQVDDASEDAEDVDGLLDRPD